MLPRVAILVLLIGCRELPAARPEGPADAALDATPDAALIDAGPDNDGDGPPVRQPCTSAFGTALSATYGRLDGILVSVVPPASTSACNADGGHVHLQVRVAGEIYDVAVNVGSDVHTTTRDVALVEPWQEGWHTTASVDYPTSLGVTAAATPLSTQAALVNALMADLATVNHIAIYATGYGPDGVHLVHRNGSGHDGLIVTRPLSAAAHLRLFSFTGQVF